MVLDQRVVRILDDLGLERYMDNFEEQEVSYEDLTLLNESDLVQLGIMTIGPRRRMLEMCQHTKSEPTMGKLEFPPASAHSQREGSIDDGSDYRAYPSVRVEAEFKAVDTDNDGLINLLEVMQAVHALSPEILEDNIRTTFAAYDNDGSGMLDLQEFRIAYNMLRQDQFSPRPGKSLPEDKTPNLCAGKYFVGRKGGGRYCTVAGRDEDVPGAGSIQLDMFDDGSFVYHFEANHDDMPDGQEVLTYFLESLFGSLHQNANKVSEMQELLSSGGINSMSQLCSKSKNELDQLGIPIGSRAKITASRKVWRPPRYNDESFIVRGRWQARELAGVCQVRFIANEEELTAYDGVKMPCNHDFTLDAGFVPSGACRGLNGNMPAPGGLMRSFLVYTTDPREEEEVGWVKCKKETISHLCGARMSKLCKEASWLVDEYKVQSKELLQSGGCYVDQTQVKRCHDKFSTMKTTLDQCLAVFEDYYGATPRESE